MVLSHLVGSVLHLGHVVLEAVEEAVEDAEDVWDVEGLVLDVAGLVLLLDLETSEMVVTLNWAERARMQKVENFLES
jgi:hypothetical protein